MTVALEVRDLTGGPGDRPILKGISLMVDQGEVHALMGPNGSGKSTLSYCLMGRPGYAVTAGSATVDGTDILGLPVHKRARAGLFVGHQYPIEVPGVPNRGFLDEVKAAVGSSVDPAEVAADFDVPAEYLDRFLNEGFSGGEKKRNELLQLAVIRPKVAVLDEIDSGLDVDALRSVATGIERMTGTGLSVVLITHYTRILEYVKADHVHVMLDGAVVESGDASLADALEAEGYERFRKAAAASSEPEQ